MDCLQQLIEAFRCLPGVGPKSAQRMVYHLLQSQRQRGLHLATCLEKAMQVIQHCTQCNNFSEDALCGLCRNAARNTTQLCIVESPADVLAIEHSSAYNGLYYVLMKKISPLDGIGPDDLPLRKLRIFMENIPVQEIIFALSPTIEGQTTIHFIKEYLQAFPIQMSQLAQGIPMGGNLEFLDGFTIGSALRNRALVYE